MRACFNERFLSSAAAAMLESKGSSFAHANILAGKFSSETRPLTNREQERVMRLRVLRIYSIRSLQKARKLGQNCGKLN